MLQEQNVSDARGGSRPVDEPRSWDRMRMFHLAPNAMKRPDRG